MNEHDPNEKMKKPEQAAGEAEEMPAEDLDSEGEAAAPAGEEVQESPVLDLEEIAHDSVKITREILSFFPRVQAPKVSSRVENGTVCVDIEGDPSGRLIGRKGQTILAFQHVLSKIVSHRLRKKITIHVDAEHYRKRHLEKLAKLAIQTADYVAATRTARALEPMPAADRRMIHLTLKGRKDVVTVSEGKDPNRFVVIWPSQKE